MHRVPSASQPLLYSQPCTSSLDQLELLLDTLNRRKQFGNEVKELTILGRVFKSKGYGIRIQRLLKSCQNVRKLELVGIDDLRPKHLISQGAMTHLSLLNSSFRPHSLVNPPNLSSFVSGLTHLTLSNLGLPPPSTHLSVILSHASPTLKYLAISSIRDVEFQEFRQIFEILSTQCTKLSTLVLGFLTDEQVEALCLPSISSSISPYPILSQLSHLSFLTFTLPHPSLSLLLSIPPNLQTLTIRPPYSRSLLSRPVVGHSKQALLAVLNPVPSPSTTNTGGTNTPSSPATFYSGGGLRRRTRSIPLELLEEEETILAHLTLALLPNPPKLQFDKPHSSLITREVKEVEVLRGGESMLAENGLKSVRWECKGLRGGKERVNEIMRERERVKEKKRLMMQTIRCTPQDLPTVALPLLALQNEHNVILEVRISTSNQIKSVKKVKKTDPIYPNRYELGPTLPSKLRPDPKVSEKATSAPRGSFGKTVDGGEGRNQEVSTGMHNLTTLKDIEEKIRENKRDIEEIHRQLARIEQQKQRIRSRQERQERATSIKQRHANPTLESKSQIDLSVQSSPSSSTPGTPLEFTQALDDLAPGFQCRLLDNSGPHNLGYFAQILQTTAFSTIEALLHLQVDEIDLLMSTLKKAYEEGGKGVGIHEGQWQRIERKFEKKLRD
ncbi:hypothetical protein JCM3765_000675 [Sporobolomyces pararoseus]